ncbi:MAG: hypothetical protein JWP03_1982 [Phycisphaerales bacterium]|nr:hypothetical protein [Phycisphaerales bacterium]
MSSDIATHTTLLPRAELASGQLAAMYELLSAHFEGVTFNQFLEDAAEKNWAILIERAGRLVGFTTILAYETSVDGETVSVVYSGDTIVAPEAWNTASLPRAWIESVAKLRLHYPNGPYLWLLITSGFRTYRFLPLFWREFYPRPGEPTPMKWQRLMGRLAAERFGSRYDASCGIVRLANPQRLRGALAKVPAARLDDPYVAFFTERNMGHAEGDELVCVTELAPENLTAAGRRMTVAIPRW